MWMVNILWKPKHGIVWSHSYNNIWKKSSYEYNIQLYSWLSTKLIPWHDKNHDTTIKTWHDTKHEGGSFAVWRIYPWSPCLRHRRRQNFHSVRSECGQTSSMSYNINPNRTHLEFSVKLCAEEMLTVCN